MSQSCALLSLGSNINDVFQGERSLENRKKRVHSFKKVCEEGFKLEELLSVLLATFDFFVKMKLVSTETHKRH